jgi:biofilm PGA synthesis lipoprotein PgaB
MNGRAIILALALLAATGFGTGIRAAPAAPSGGAAIETHGGARNTKILPPSAPVYDWNLLAAGKNRFFVLCYHDVVPENDGDRYAVNTGRFVQQIEFLRHEGFTFISVDDILAARDGTKPLPPKAVLLTVDDAYLSFRTQVFPVLRAYRIPCVLAVVDSWIDNPPQDPEYDKPFLTWEQIRELASSGLVEIASHTHNLHQDVMTDPFGSTAAAVVSRAFDPVSRRQETEAAYAARIQADLRTAAAAIQAKTGKASRVLVWPYGLTNQTAAAAAKEAGFQLCFTLDDGFGSAAATDSIPRRLLKDNPDLEHFAKAFRAGFPDYRPQRVIHADLDQVYDDDPAVMAHNIDLFVERMYRLRPTTVYLQAFADPDGDGNVSETYFPNTVLPVRANLFGRVARALSIRGIDTYAWMPMLSFQFPDPAATDALRVREFRKGQDGPRPSTAAYRRLSPFSPDARRKILALFNDLARNCAIDGILFQDDAYLDDGEDFHPDAITAYLRITGGNLLPFNQLTEAQKDAWTDVKTHRLTALALEIRDVVRKHRPQARFARTLYAPVVLTPAAEEWFAQNYDDTLANFDYAVVMAYPNMEGVTFRTAWLRKLVAVAGTHPGAMDKTVFKIQTQDWKTGRAIPPATLNRQLRALLASGARHVGYYPDDLFADSPAMNVIRQTIGFRDIPFDPLPPEPKPPKPHPEPTAVPAHDPQERQEPHGTDNP